MRKIVEEDDSLETCSSARSRMDPTDLEEHFEEPRAGILPILAQCCASVSTVLDQQMQMYWLMFIDSVDDLLSKVVVETHEHLVDVEQDGVV